MHPDKITSPVPAGAAACADDTAPAGTLAALALLFSDLERDADALRELVRDTLEPTALTCVLSDALALLSWRCDFGRKLAGDTGVTTATEEERFIRSEVLRHGGAA
ncbi:hypothetical protein [Sphaerotilus uruguayifluvii]|uniref:Uncharacterized protein n=1 Tax=Sphaerotilus uruguayifluvii TaxID=2735897 RepID=A0ABX2G193_9BURK|nr:hypothetical protein [Leptothrix sp. C29]NRT55194.1 hypothetical protein [Leptothrix sp. C29]